MAVKRYNAPVAETEPDYAKPIEDWGFRESGPTKLFDITCTVGTVFSGGDVSPRVAAFRVIAEHSEGRSGTYSFPNSDGTTTHVTVEDELKS